MENFDQQINDLINKMDSENISKEQQIEYLKSFSYTLNNRKEEIYNNFIIGTFISGFGLGYMANYTSMDNVYISLGLIAFGMLISLSSTNSKYINKDKTKTKKI